MSRGGRAPAAPEYLAPFHAAHRRRARGPGALLYDTRDAQFVRLEAIARHCPLAGLHVLDVGCGRAELLGLLLERGVVPARYTGIEALPWLARAARRRRYPRCTILEADFVKEPERMRVGADVVVFSGSLNLLPSRQFYRTLRQAWDAAGRRLAFNYLCSPREAGDPWLRWHRRRTVLAFLRRSGAEFRVHDDYAPGDDCTVVMHRRGG
ncbi:MAG TPA: methyltransferase domain-containing protein [Thermoanaerobaculia bacterium]|nr:methyltransferase domain-containing protein [Thermoanaerobaculia bacterium]